MVAEPFLLCMSLFDIQVEGHKFINNTEISIICLFFVLVSCNHGELVLSLLADRLKTKKCHNTSVHSHSSLQTWVKRINYLDKGMYRKLISYCKFIHSVTLLCYRFRTLRFLRKVLYSISGIVDFACSSVSSKFPVCRQQTAKVSTCGQWNMCTLKGIIYFVKLLKQTWH